METIGSKNLLDCIGGSRALTYIRSLAISFINVIKAVMNVRSYF